MKKIFLFITAIAFGLTVYSKNDNIKITFQTNKIHCLFNFIDAISGSNYGSYALKDYFDKSKFNTPENQQLLEKYTQLDLFNGLSYSEFPASRKMGETFLKY